MYLLKVKKASALNGPWDIADVARTIPGKQAFQSKSESSCKLLSQ